MRLLALSAAALIGAACSSQPPPACSSGSLSVDWQLRDPHGALWSCGAAGVSTIDIYLDGVRQVDAAPCVNGTASITGVPVGSHSLTVEGLDAHYTIIDREQLLSTG